MERKDINRKWENVKSESLSISSFFLQFLFIYSFSLHFLAVRLPGCSKLCNPGPAYSFISTILLSYRPGQVPGTLRHGHRHHPRGRPGCSNTPTLKRFLFGPEEVLLEEVAKHNRSNLHSHEYSTFVLQNIISKGRLFKFVGWRIATDNSLSDTQLIFNSIISFLPLTFNMLTLTDSLNFYFLPLLTLTCSFCTERPSLCQ